METNTDARLHIGSWVYFKNLQGYAVVIRKTPTRVYVKDYLRFKTIFDGVEDFWEKKSFLRATRLVNRLEKLYWELPPATNALEAPRRR